MYLKPSCVCDWMYSETLVSNNVVVSVFLICVCQVRFTLYIFVLDCVHHHKICPTFIWNRPLLSDNPWDVNVKKNDRVSKNFHFQSLPGQFFQEDYSIEERSSIYFAHKKT